jgi:hypothetical protein
VRKAPVEAGEGALLHGNCKLKKKKKMAIAKGT